MSNNDESLRVQYAPIEVRHSSSRQTPNSDFAVTLQRGIFKTSGVVRRAMDSAGYAIPGAAVVGAAINEFTVPADTQGAPGPGAGGMLAQAGGASPGGLGAGGGLEARARGGDTTAQNMAFMQQMQETNQMFNLQYLQLQQNVQDESRRFSLVSNIMKTKHDTARNSVQNLK